MHQSPERDAANQCAVNQDGKRPAGEIVNRCSSGGDDEMECTPSSAVPMPPWNELRPINPLAMPWKTRMRPTPEYAAAAIALQSH
jgi:hypothetical protein